RSRLVARRAGLHVGAAIRRRVVHSSLVVHVRAGGSSANTGIADDLCAFNSRADDRGKRRKMRVPRSNAKPMVDHYQATVARVSLSDRNHAVRRSMNRRAIIRSYVHASVERTLTAERVEALAEAIRNVSHDRPNRGRI